jgi:hypothetical protein
VQNAEKYCADLTARTPGQGEKVFSGVAYIRVRDAKVSFEDSLTGGIHFTSLHSILIRRTPTSHSIAGSAQLARTANALISGSRASLGLHHPGQLNLLPAAEDARTRLQRISDLMSFVLGRKNRRR